jgi:hypothetical protein
MVAAAMMIVIGYMIHAKLVNDSPLYTYNLTVPNLSQQIGQDVGSGILATDNVFFMMYIGLFIASIVLAFMTQSHPLFIIATVILIIVELLIAPVMANVYEQFTSTTGDVFNASLSFPKTNWIISHLPMLVLIQGILVGMVMFGVRQQ